MLSATCSHVPSGEDGTSLQTAENPVFAGLSSASREIRTPTIQTDHKALNLARDLLVLSAGRRNAHSIRDDGRFEPGGQCVCCQSVVTATVMAGSRAESRTVAGDVQGTVLTVGASFRRRGMRGARCNQW